MSAREFEPMPAWQVILGGLGFAAVAFALIWGFAVLGYALEGAGS